VCLWWCGERQKNGNNCLLKAVHYKYDNSAVNSDGIIKLLIVRIVITFDHFCMNQPKLVMYQIQNIYHIQGAGDDLAAAQQDINDEIRSLLDGSEVQLVTHSNMSRADFQKLLQDAEKGDIFIFDGHGIRNGTTGSIILNKAMADDVSRVTGEELSAWKGKPDAILYLNCCYGVFVAHAGHSLDMGDQSLQQEYLRYAVANMCMLGSVCADANVKVEVDTIMADIVRNEVINDDADFSSRICGQLCRIGLDRTYWFTGIVPLSIGMLGIGLETDIIFKVMRALLNKN
jgi:hypothetical protein